MKRIQQISVTNLFGMFNHVIPLNIEDRITIIHGPNGFGKTLILKLLSELFGQSDLLLFGQMNIALRTTPFDEFRVDFEDGTRFWVSKTSKTLPIFPGEDTREERSFPHIAFYDSSHSSEKQAFTFSLKPSLGSIQMAMAMQGLPISVIGDTIPGLEHTGATTWKYRPTGETLSLEEVAERFGDRIPIKMPRNEEPDWLYSKGPDWLQEMRQAVSIHFIETQRPLDTAHIQDEYEKQLAMVPTVTLYAKDLLEAIKVKTAEYAVISQSLDSTFPTRFVKFIAQYPQALADDELRSKFAKLDGNRSRLIAAGLLDRENNDNFQVNQDMDDRTRFVMSIYIEDAERKLAVFDEIVQKIELLTKIINKRFLYKHMSTSKEYGFVFTTSDGTNLALTDLSSGEQHELVLFYELLFKAAPGSLILIDEPELSLHVVWQEQFLKNVQEITLINKFDVLMATHSPDIINDRRDLMVELKGLSNGRLQRVQG